MTVKRHYRELVEIISKEYTELVEKWKQCDLTIKLIKSKSHEHIVGIDSLIMQKKLITTHMKIINSVRIKDFDNCKILVEKYKSVALDLIDFTGEQEEIIDFNTGDINEQAYIKLCNHLKQRVDQFDNLTKFIEMYKKYCLINNKKL